MANQQDPINMAKNAGFDMNLIDTNLTLTHEERARQHDQALALVLEFDRIRRERESREDWQNK